MSFSEKQISKAMEVLEKFQKTGFLLKYQGKTYQGYHEWDKDRELAIPEIREAFQPYFNGSGDLAGFKKASSEMAFKHNLWGFTAYSGQMFLNQIVDWSEDPQKTRPILFNALRLPNSREDAIQKINNFAKELPGLIRAEKRVGLRVGSIPFLLSYFWHIQNPSFAPMYYHSTKVTLEALGLWESGRNLGESFAGYWTAHDLLSELYSKAFDEKKENKYLFVEHVCWVYKKAQNTKEPVYAAPEHGVSPSAEGTGDYLKNIALVGTWKDVDDYVEELKRSIRKNGGWASPWSFPIKDGAKKYLVDPFYVYLNVGGGALKYRMKVEEFNSTKGTTGISSPWPKITDEEHKGGTQFSDTKPIKTWFRVTEIEELNPPVDAFSVKIIKEFTKNSRQLLNQSTFGYFDLDVREPDGGVNEIPYSTEDAMKGLFVPREQFSEMIELLRRKKNVILQGPPGVGKSFMAKRLAFALMGEENEGQLGFAQFHQSYGYEHFIQGFRPVKNGGFELVKGVFYRFCEEARQLPDRKFVFIVDEINRGNLSRIFGELMLLIESDKRGPEWGISLAHSDDDQEDFYVPENVYLLGLMNTADRSIAMVDYALRRRFGFFDIKPGFDEVAFEKELRSSGATPAIVRRIRDAMGYLNREIADDNDLGPGFVIGHSYFCPIDGESEKLDGDWYTRIINREIAPLLREYWFDSAPNRVKDVMDKLIAQ